MGSGRKKYVTVLYMPIVIYMFGLVCVLIWLSSALNMSLFSIASFFRDPLLYTIFLVFELYLIFLLWYVANLRITIDAKGVRSRFPFSKRRSGFIRWKRVRCVGVFRTGLGERLMFISTIPNVWEGRNMMKNDLPRSKLTKMGYSKKAMAVIKQYYKGEVVEV